MADQPRPSRGRAVALVLSLCLNVLLIGLLVVGLGRAVQGGFIAQPGGQLAPGQIARALAPADQAKVRGIIAQHQPAMRQARQGARRARLAAFRIFAAPDYTPDAFAQALEAVREADSRLEEQAIALLRDTVDTLTPDQRKAIVTRARSGANRPWWRRILGRPAPRPPQ